MKRTSTMRSPVVSWLKSMRMGMTNEPKGVGLT